jgi:hypothetical protein
VAFPQVAPNVTIQRGTTPLEEIGIGPPVHVVRILAVNTFAPGALLRKKDNAEM